MTSRTTTEAERAVISFKKNNKRPKEEQSSFRTRLKTVKNTKKFGTFFQEFDLTISRLVANVTRGIGKEW